MRPQSGSWVVAAVFAALAVPRAVTGQETTDLPPGAVRRLGTLDLRPGPAPSSLTTISGGRQVLTTANGLSVWDLATGQEVVRVAPPPWTNRPRVNDPRIGPGTSGRLRLDPDETAVYYLYDYGALRFRLPLTDRPPEWLPALDADGTLGLTGLAPSPVDKSLAGLTSRGEVVILRPGAAAWISPPGKVSPVVLNPKTRRTAPPMASGGRVFATGGEDGEVRVWEFLAGEPAGRVREVGVVASDPVEEITVSADGGRVAVIGKSRRLDRVVRVWDTKTLRQLTEWTLTGRGVRHITLSANGSLVAAADTPESGVVTVYDIGAGKELKRLSAAGDELHALHFLPNGSGLLAVGAAGVIHHWTLPGGEYGRPDRGHRSAVRAAIFLPGGGYASGGEDGFVIVYDAAGAEARRFLAHGAERYADHHCRLNALVSSPDGTTLYSAGRDRMVRSWDITTGKLRAEQSVMENPTDRLTYPCVLAASKDGKRVAAGLNEFGVQLLDATTLALSGRFGLRDTRCSGIGYAAEGRVVVATDSKKVTTVWAGDPPAEALRVRTKAAWPVPARLNRPLGFPDPVILSVSADGVWFTGPLDGAGKFGMGPMLGVWSATDGGLAAQIDMADLPPLCTALSPDGKRVAVGGADGSIRIFDVATGGLRRTLTGHRGAVLCLTMSPDGRRLLSGSIDTTALVWELR